MERKNAGIRKFIFLTILSFAVVGFWGFGWEQQVRETASVQKKKRKVRRGSYFGRASDLIRNHNPDKQRLLWVTEPMEKGQNNMYKRRSKKQAKHSLKSKKKRSAKISVKKDPEKN